MSTTFQELFERAYYEQDAGGGLEYLTEADRLRNKLEEAINDIPHVGRLCKYKTDEGYCTLDERYCCYQMRTPCERWEWRGNNG